MRKALPVYISLLFCIGYATGQETPFKLLKTIAGEYSDMTVDQLGSIYLVTAGGQLRKTAPDGSITAVFNEVRKYGKLYAIDVSNPLKTLLYYRDFGTVVVLDRFLNIRNVMDLRQSGLFQVKCLGQAFDNGYWVFDEQDGRVKHLNESAIVTDQFTDFRLLFDSMPSPQQMVDQQKYLYLYDSVRGVYVFDYYGTFRLRLPYRGWKDFFVINSMLFGRNEKFIFRYDMQRMQEQSYPLLPEMREAVRIRISSDNLYVLYKSRLEVHQIARQ